MVGLFNRLFAWFGHRLLPIKAIEDERLANARAIEALDRRIANIADDRDALSAEIERLTQVHAEDQAASQSQLREVRTALDDSRAATAAAAAEVERIAQAREEELAATWARLHQVRAALDNSRAVATAAREALASQAQAFAERSAAELTARRGVEEELWGKINAARSALEAEQRRRETEARRAQASGEAQAEAHAQALGKMWARLDREGARTATALAVADKARRKIESFLKKIEDLSGKLEREVVKRSDAEALAGNIRGSGAMRVIRRFRARDQLDLAATALERSADLSRTKYDGYYLQVLVELDDNQRMQEGLRRSIARLPAVAPDSESDYLTTLCRHAGLSCLEPPVIDMFLAKTERAGRKPGPLRTARDAMRRRHQFARALSQDWEGHGTLISLGLNCMPWTLPNRWGLRSPEEFCSLFTPFAYGVHKFKGVARALQTDFEDYCQPESMVSVETKNSHLTAMRKDGGAVWNHNLGPYWLDGGFPRLRETLGEKAARLRAACRQDDAVFIMSKAPIAYPEEPVSIIETLNEVLQPFTGRANNRVLFWNEHAEAAGRYRVDPWTHVLNCPYPTGGYIWYHDETADGPEALAYEAGCAQAIIDSMQDWGLMRPRGEADVAVAAAAVAVG